MNKEATRAGVGQGSPTRPDLAVLVIGASNADMASLVHVLLALPSNVSLAVILVFQHHDAPSRAVLELALGARASTLAAVTDGAPVEVGRIFLTGPGLAVTVSAGRFHTRSAGGLGSGRETLDHLLTSLAADQDKYTIDLMLAAAGNEGALGATAVKKAGGLVLAEQAATARSAGPDAPTEFADLVLPLRDLPARIALHTRQVARWRAAQAVPNAGRLLNRVTDVLHERTGHDFRGYKRDTLLRRIQRRMQVLGTDEAEAYIVLLRTHPGEVQLLFNELLVSVASFFRDPHEFEFLQARIVPRLFDGKGRGDQVCVWVPGCSTGEEAYSVAMLLCEYAAGLDAPPAVKIFASDIDERALAFARAGRYGEGIADAVGPERLARWFSKQGGAYSVSRSLRDSCVFSQHSVIRDAPFSRLDLVSCQNLMIYMDAGLQAQVIPLLQFGLRPGGFLFFGNAETASRHATLFRPLGLAPYILQRLSMEAPPPDFPSMTAGRPRAGTAALPCVRPAGEALARRAEHVAQRHAPAYAVIDAKFDVLHFSSKAKRYIRPSGSTASPNLLSLVHANLQPGLQGVLTTAVQERRPVETIGLQMDASDAWDLVDVTVEPLPDTSEPSPAFIVLFRDHKVRMAGDASRPIAADGQVQRLEAELHVTRERLQAAIEDLKDANEELRISNEELQASKDGLQSFNEKLTTVNGELEHRLAELAHTSSDMKNLLESTQIAMLFLDKESRVASYTPASKEVFHLAEAGIGQPIADISPRVAYPELQEDVRQVVQTLGTVSREVGDPATRRRYMARVLPYCNGNRMIAGTVVTFTDVMPLTHAEAALRDSEERYRTLFNSMDQGFALIEVRAAPGEPTDFRFIEVNHAFEAQVTLVGARGRWMRDLLPGHEEEWYSLFAGVVLTGEPVRTERQAQVLGERWFDLFAFRVGSPAGRRVGVLSTDVTSRRRNEQALRENEARLQLALDAASMGSFVWHVAENRTEADERLLALCGLPPGDMLGRAGVLSSFLHPEDRTRYAGKVATMLDPLGSGAFSGEFRAAMPDGSQRWLGIAVQAQFGGEPRRAVRAVGTMVDITARKSAEAALRDSEERFRGFANNRTATLWIAAGHGERLEYLSPAFERMFGDPRDRTMADIRRWDALVHPEDRREATSFMAHAVQGGVTVANYRMIRPSDGVVRWLRATGFPVRGAQSAIVSVAGILQDLTDAEVTAAALLEERERFCTLVEDIPHLVWRSDNSGLWTWASRQWLDYTGQIQEQSYGWGWLDAVHPNDRETMLQAWREALPKGWLEVENRLRRASDGEWRWHQTRAVPLRGAPGPGHPDGQILEWLAVSNDIEDLKRLQGGLEVLVAELQHRTRNVLSVARNFARRSFAPSPERDEYDARLTALGRVQGFLSRLPAGLVPLAELVSAELDATEGGEARRIMAEGPQVDLQGDGVQPMALALHELATNAVKHGALSRASGRLAITWRIEGSGAAARLTLDWRETGVPIPTGLPARRGFGTELISRALPYQLKADTELRFTPDGIHCIITLPADKFSVGRPA